MNFKNWFLKNESIAYQPENWTKFFRQTINKLKFFEAKYNQEYLNEINNQLKNLEENYCTNSERNFIIASQDFIKFIIYVINNSEYLPSNIILKIYNSEIMYYEMHKYMIKYFLENHLINLQNYQNNYEEFLNDFNAIDFKSICGDEYYAETNPFYEKIKIVIKDFLVYINAFKNFAEKYLLSISIANKEKKQYYDSSVSERETFPPHEDFEYLYHASTNLPAILKTGFKYRDELTSSAGLGGGPSDLISFTSNLNIAKAIANTIKQLVKIAKGELTLDTIIQRYKRLNLITDEDVKKKKINFENNDREVAFSLFRQVLRRGEEKGLRYDPFLYSPDIENFAKINTNDIGIIKAKIDMSKVKTYNKSEEEYRVPKEAIISFEKY